MSYEPTRGVTYWYITDTLGVNIGVFQEGKTILSSHEMRQTKGNCFKTEAEALAMKKQIEKLLKGE